MNLQPILEQWLASSTDAQKVALHWEGIFLSASTAVVFVATSVLHLTFNTSDYATLVTGFGFIIGAIVFVHGLIRSVFVKFGTKNPIGTVGA